MDVTTENEWQRNSNTTRNLNDGMTDHFKRKPNFNVIACEQALRGTLAAGQEKEGELATTSLEL